MKAIVTGATGGLGRNMVEFLQAQGHEVIGCGRNKSIGNSLPCKFKSFDLADKQAVLDNFESVDVVFHCAALSSPWGRYEEFYDANVVATKNVLSAINELKIPRMVHVSTPSVYFDFEDHELIKESYLSKKFANHYAHTKYLAEQEVLNSPLERLHVSIIRPRAIFGEYDSVIVPRIEKIVARTKIPFIKNKQVIVDVTYVGNVVHAMYLCATKDIPSKQVFNITNDQPMEIYSVISLLAKSIGIDLHMRLVNYTLMYGLAVLLETFAGFLKTKEPLVTRYSIGVIGYSQTLDISNAKKQLGYKPVYSIEQGVERYAKWRNKVL